MGEQDRVAVIGAGIIGCAIACALARAGRRVLLADPEEPGVGGASFGNAGHIAAELVEPLPSPALLFGFWRELVAFGGSLDIPWRRLPHVALWARPFAAAAFRRRASAEAARMTKLGIPTAPVAAELLRAVASAAGGETIAGLEFPDSGHILDPRAVCEVLARAAVERGTTLHRTRVRSLALRGEHIEVLTDTGAFTAATVIVCAGAWSAPLLAPFGLRVPLEAVSGYHVELPGHAPLVDAPIVYMDRSIVVTPMASRLRASSYMEFSRLAAAPDPRKPARLRADLRRLGYRCESGTSSWVGPRPVLPDYLPGIGRAPGAARLFYAIGHQHLGLTLAPVTADLVVALVSGREPAHDVTPFDLRRFN